MKQGAGQVTPRMGTGKKTQQRNNSMWSWVWSPVEAMRQYFMTTTGSPNRPGKRKSVCAEDLYKVAEKHPEHGGILEIVGRLVELEDSVEDVLKIGKEQKDRHDSQRKRIRILKREKGELQSKYSSTKRDLDRHVSRKENLEASVSILADPSVRERLPILWGQSLDTVAKELPGVAEIMGKAGGLGRLLPREDSGAVCLLGTEEEIVNLTGCKDDFSFREATFFVAAKQERGLARESEDRIGFLIHDGGFRAIALDGVGGSMHPRHLVRELGERALSSRDFIASIKETLGVVGEGMVEETVRLSKDDKLAFFQKQRLSGGAACVLAAVDYDDKMQRATVHQIGDTVAFVERGDGEWSVYPSSLTDGKSFDSTPEQLNCKSPSDAKQIETFEIGNATGRIALATDGVAEHILLNGGIGKFINRIRKYGEDGGSLLGDLRSEGIADDDLSFLMIETI